ncbi:hypothetical protein IL992_01060 [Microbispora sp. NEAU-D428]|uniref:hypothetical protein n=1 Tax=Microbispora sitophila TaxID=2771537 RepID=UPI0018687497|nr:hypothetical protein [Microbispora sitophila]MBE3007791.1 hypothetical protein [Microbispora sitophila]
MADLLIDLMAVRHQMETSTPDDVTELHRVTAALASVHANALTRLGEHGAALRWGRTARQAADASGDLRLRLLVRGEEAGHGLYGQRGPETVLALVESAERIAGGSSVDLLTTRAKALTVLGRHNEARTALDDLLRPASSGVTADSFGFWKPTRFISRRVGSTPERATSPRRTGHARMCSGSRALTSTTRTSACMRRCARSLRVASTRACARRQR